MSHQINLAWPTWARVASTVRAELANETARTWSLIRRTARLAVKQLELEQLARRVPEWHAHLWIYLPSFGSSLVRARCVTCSVSTTTHRLPPSFRRHARRFARFVVALLFVLASSSLIQANTAVAEEKREESALFRAMGIATYAVYGGDLASTELGLSTGLGYEANPFMENRAVRVGSHVALPVLINRTTAELYQKGRTKTALWMRISIVAAYGYLTAHNLRQWNKVR